MTSPAASFSTPGPLADYAARTARIVPGLHDLHKMTGVLLSERAPANARILVLGAGGGLELKAFAEMSPGWRFDGVDPSPDMLRLAEATLGPLASCVRFHEGLIGNAPDGPFDAATCLLTLHFLEADERRQTVGEVHRRLRPGAPFVVAHHSFPNEGPDRDRWLTRYAAYAVASGVPAAQAHGSIEAMKARLPALTPEQDTAILREAGFSGVELFYAGFTFKGWVGYRA